jgi:hypothetical protein
MRALQLYKSFYFLLLDNGDKFKKKSSIYKPFINRVNTRNKKVNEKKRPCIVEIGTIGGCRLNTSLPWYLHPSSIKPVFCRSSKMSLFKGGFELRCFQLLSSMA